MSKKREKKLDFFAAFAQLPLAQKAAVVVGLRMFAQVEKSGFGSVTFSRNDIENLHIYDDAELFDPSKALDFAERLSMEVF